MDLKAVEKKYENMSPGMRSKAMFREAKEPRTVYAKLRIMDISKLNNVDLSARVDFHLLLRWFDPAMIGVGKNQFGRTVKEYETLWNPKIEVNNDISLKPIWDGDVSWNFKSAETGEMKYSQRYIGEIKNPMDFRNFPFDTDELSIDLGSTYFGNKKVVLEYDPDWNPSSIPIKHSLSEWEVNSVPNLCSSITKNTSGTEYSNLNFKVVIRRNYEYYIWKILIINFLVCIWSWTVFWMDAKKLSERMNTSLTLFLASVAFLFVVNDKLPKVPYLTVLDKLILVSFLLLFTSAFESFICFILSEEKYFNIPSTCFYMDYASCVVFPIILVCSGVYYLYSSISKQKQNFESHLSKPINKTADDCNESEMKEITPEKQGVKFREQSKDRLLNVN